MIILVATLKNNCLSKFLERIGKMSASTAKLEFYDVEERFILCLPDAEADVTNSSKPPEKPLTILLDDDMKSGEVFVNGKKLYGKMVNMTSLYGYESTIKSVNLKPAVMSQVMVCQEQKFKSGTSVNGSFFSIQTEVKAADATTKHKFRRVLSKWNIPVAKGEELKNIIKRAETKKRTKRAKRNAS